MAVQVVFAEAVNENFLVLMKAYLSQESQWIPSRVKMKIPNLINWEDLKVHGEKRNITVN